MKKKDARELVPGDKLVMVCDGSYGAAFKVGDMVSFAMNENSQKMVVSGLGGGRRIDQTISRKDVELYTERPHEVLRATYKAGQEWEFKKIGETCAFMSMLGHEPEWLASFEYRLKPETTKPQTPQGHDSWAAGYHRLNGKDATIPAPLDAAPELYCLVRGTSNRMCSIDGSKKVKTGTLDKCNQIAESLRRNFPSEKYRVMRLTPVDSGEGRTTA